MLNLSHSIFFRTNANIDLIISGVDLLHELGVEETGIGKDCSEISTLDVLGECFSYFMAKGAAAERPITTHELNTRIVAATTRLTKSQVQLCSDTSFIVFVILFAMLLSAVWYGRPQDQSWFQKRLEVARKKDWIYSLKGLNKGLLNLVMIQESVSFFKRIWNRHWD